MSKSNRYQKPFKSNKSDERKKLNRNERRFIKEKLDNGDYENLDIDYTKKEKLQDKWVD